MIDNVGCAREKEGKNSGGVTMVVTKVDLSFLSKERRMEVSLE